jgi:hypothetical protein
LEPAPATAPRGDLAREYFRQMRTRFEHAAAVAGGAVVEDLRIAGHRLRLSCAGDALREALLSPFEHLAVERGGDPQLSIRLFDTASTGVEAPPPGWEPLDAAPGTNPVARLRSERACVLAAAGTGAVTAAEPNAGEAIFYLPDVGRIAASERAAPLREALQLLMAPRGRWMTHAGAVGRDGRGVLLVGRGGSGKSTLALSCALAGMEIVADDYVLLESGSPPVAHAMQSTAKLTEDSAERLGLAEGSIDDHGFEPTLEGPAKALVDIRALAPGRLRGALRIGALVAPVLPVARSRLVTHGATNRERTAFSSRSEPSLRPVSAARGLRAVAPSTIVQSGFQGAPSLAALADLVRQVPCYALELGSDPTANARVVDRLVEELG